MLEALTKNELDFLYLNYEKEEIENATPIEIINALWAYWAFKEKLNMWQVEERENEIRKFKKN